MSSNELAISVNGLSKCYEIYDRPQDRLKEFVWSPLRKMVGAPPKSFHRDFWALRDVSFDVRKGETVGIIGHNGSGKSTLLQMIAGTLSPTTGSVKVNGRVAALLELGSGFNPEFTGRENVLLYAQILGMDQDQIKDKYEEIVDFSEIRDFIDQPLKTYSSGMAMRLAFSVVAHVDPEVLIVDEALSVGDVFFQAKCMMLMRKLLDTGMTLLFVSHDSGSVKSLCSRAVLLDHGNMVMASSADEVVEKYYATFVSRRQTLKTEGQAGVPVPAAPASVTPQSDPVILESNQEFLESASFHRLQNGKAEFLNVMLVDQKGERLREVDFNEEVTLRMIIRCNEDLPLLGFGYHLKDRNGADLAYSDTGIEDKHIYNPKAGEIHVAEWRMRMQFREGQYSISAVLAVPLDLTVGKVETCDHVPIALQFHMNKGRLPLYGAMRLDADLQVSLRVGASAR